MHLPPPRTFQAGPVDQFSIEWAYKPLRDIRVSLRPGARFAMLLCEHDSGGEMFTAHCHARNFRLLEPYAALLLQYMDDPLAVEKPVAPVVFTRGGRAIFSRAGARMDHGTPLPSLRPATTYRLARRPAPLPRELAWAQTFFRF